MINIAIAYTVICGLTGLVASGIAVVRKLNKIL
jgi:hypothetical protein